MIARLLFLSLLFVPSFTFAQWLTSSDFDERAQKGIRLVYDLQFKKAEIEFSTLVKNYPAHPAGKFFLGMIEWWKILISIDDETRDDIFIKKMDEVIELCDSLLDVNSSDVTALFFKGGALGFQGRLRANRSSWIKAANDGRLALPVVQKAYSIAPENYDILLGIGIYNYYASTIPERYPLVKPLLVFFPTGDKKKGIEQLEKASRNARYAAIEAQYFLLQLNFNYERQYEKALELSAALFQQYPNNGLFHRYLGRCFFILSRNTEAEVVFTNIIERCEQQQRGYSEFVQREARYYLGMAHMQRDEYDKALKHFYICDALSRNLDRKEQSGFMVLTNLKIGMIYDLQKKRDFALKQYKKVTTMRKFENSHELAERYKKEPYGS